MYELLRAEWGTSHSLLAAVCTVYSGTIQNDPMRKLLADGTKTAYSTSSLDHDCDALPKEFLVDVILSHRRYDEDVDLGYDDLDSYVSQA